MWQAIMAALPMLTKAGAAIGGGASAMPAAGMGQGAAAAANPAMGGGGAGLFDSIMGGTGIAGGEKMGQMPMDIMPPQSQPGALPGGQRTGSIPQEGGGLWDTLMRSREGRFKRNDPGMEGVYAQAAEQSGQPQDPMAAMQASMGMGMAKNNPRERTQMSPRMNAYIQSLLAGGK